MSFVKINHENVVKLWRIVLQKQKVIRLSALAKKVGRGENASQHHEFIVALTKKKETKIMFLSEMNEHLTWLHKRKNIK